MRLHSSKPNSNVRLALERSDRLPRKGRKFACVAFGLWSSHSTLSISAPQSAERSRLSERTMPRTQTCREGKRHQRSSLGSRFTTPHRYASANADYQQFYGYHRQRPIKDIDAFMRLIIQKRFHCVVVMSWKKHLTNLRKMFPLRQLKYVLELPWEIRNDRLSRQRST